MLHGNACWRSTQQINQSHARNELTKENYNMYVVQFRFYVMRCARVFHFHVYFMLLFGLKCL